MKKIILPFFFATVLWASCKKDDVVGPFTGPVTPINIGKAWTTAELTESLTPTSISLNIDKYAVLSLLLSSTQSAVDVKLPQKGSYSAIKHVIIDWRPQGHADPAHIFDKPQFNFYFYLTSPAERTAATDPGKLLTVPGPGYMPENFVFDPPGVPGEGLHWHDTTAPEYKGEALQQSLSYGSYDGNINFYEWMIPIKVLAEQLNMERTIPLPGKFKTAGYYPTLMTVKMEDYTITVTLKQFEYKIP